MLIRHSLYYSIARGLPGLVSFAALAVYTRLLSTEEFGRYALVLAGVGLANVVLFQWLRLVLTRFLHAHKDHPKRLLSGVLALFLTLGASVAVIALFSVWWWVDPEWQGLAALAVILLHTQAWFELTLALAAAQLRPGWYGRMLITKVTLALAVGSLLAWVGLGTAAPIIGLIVAQVVTFAVLGATAWRGVSPVWPEMPLLRSQLQYGLPLTATFALAWIITGSDRLLIGWFLDEHAVGVYAAGYDLASQSVTLLLSIINTAAFPLAVKALETQGIQACSAQLERNGGLIIAAAVAGAVALIAIGPQIVALVIGEAFREEAARLLPVIAVAAAIAGIKAFHLDIAFHLGKNTKVLAAIDGAAAALNVALNFLLIPVYGIIGAAYATIGAYTAGLLASAIASRRAFAMPPLIPITIKATVLAMAVGVTGRLFSNVTDTASTQLIVSAISITLAAAIVSVVLNVAGVRDTAVGYWRRWRGTTHEESNHRVSSCS